MTQAVAAFTEHGIVLATDSRATRFNAAGEAEFFQVEKLFPLGRYHAILSGGAGVSVPLSLALRREIHRRRGLEDLEEITEFALPFLSQGYEQYLQIHGPDPEGFRRIYFILAGFSPHHPPPGYRLFLLGSENQELPLRLMPVGQLVVMPRHLGMEMRLVQAVQRQAPLDELLQICQDFLGKMAAAKEEVGPPFYFATITAEGYQTIEM